MLQKQLAGWHPSTCLPAGQPGLVPHGLQQGQRERLRLPHPCAPPQGRVCECDGPEGAWRGVAWLWHGVAVARHGDGAPWACFVRTRARAPVPVLQLRPAVWAEGRSGRAFGQGIPSRGSTTSQMMQIAFTISFNSMYCQSQLVVPSVPARLAGCRAVRCVRCVKAAASTATTRAPAPP